MQMMIRDTEVDVSYTLVRGCPATREEPGEPDYIEELAVMVGEVDITGLLAKDVLAEIEEACYADAEAYDEP